MRIGLGARSRLGMLERVASHHRRLAVRLEPHDCRAVGVEESADLLGHRGEHEIRPRPDGDQRRHPPQGRLLVGDPAVFRVQLGVVEGDGELLSVRLAGWRRVAIF